MTLACDPVAGASRYEFEMEYQASTGGSFSRYYAYETSASEKTFWPVYSDTTYRWRVQAATGSGWGEDSGWTEFRYAP